MSPRLRDLAKDAVMNRRVLTEERQHHGAVGVLARHSVSSASSMQTSTVKALRDSTAAII